MTPTPDFGATGFNGKGQRVSTRIKVVFQNAPGDDAQHAREILQNAYGDRPIPTCIEHCLASAEQWDKVVGTLAHERDLARAACASVTAMVEDYRRKTLGSSGHNDYWTERFGAAFGMCRAVADDMKPVDEVHKP